MTRVSSSQRSVLPRRDVPAVLPPPPERLTARDVFEARPTPPVQAVPRRRGSPPRPPESAVRALAQGLTRLLSSMMDDATRAPAPRRVGDAPVALRSLPSAARIGPDLFERPDLPRAELSRMSLPLVRPYFDASVFETRAA